MKSKKKVGTWGLLFIASLAISGCDVLTRLIQKESDPSVQPKPQSSAESDTEFSSNSAKNAKANAEILREMMMVVLVKDPTDRSDFGNWADTLNQGASLEGVYNGLAHSSNYRKLEMASRGASADALKAFGEELAELEVELPNPTQFDSTAASPLPVLGNVGSGGDSNAPHSQSNQDTLARPQPSASPNPKVLAEQYSKQFVGASIFTLKRVLGDEALRVIAQKSASRSTLAVWYSKWVVRIAQRNIDFGLALRNKPDEAFHLKWAMETSEDRLKWEVLNRLHRVLNEANRLKP